MKVMQIRDGKEPDWRWNRFSLLMERSQIKDGKEPD